MASVREALYKSMANTVITKSIINKKAYYDLFTISKENASSFSIALYINISHNMGAYSIEDYFKLSLSSATVKIGGTTLPYYKIEQGNINAASPIANIKLIRYTQVANVYSYGLLITYDTTTPSEVTVTVKKELMYGEYNELLTASMTTAYVNGISTALANMQNIASETSSNYAITILDTLTKDTANNISNGRYIDAESYIYVKGIYPETDSLFTELDKFGKVTATSILIQARQIDRFRPASFEFKDASNNTYISASAANANSAGTAKVILGSPSKVDMLGNFEYYAKALVAKYSEIYKISHSASTVTNVALSSTNMDIDYSNVNIKAQSVFKVFGATSPNSNYISYINSDSSFNIVNSGTPILKINKNGVIVKNNTVTISASDGATTPTSFNIGGLLKLVKGSASNRSDDYLIGDAISKKATLFTSSSTDIDNNKLARIKDLLLFSGNTSITTLGTIATGVWNGSRLTSDYIPTNVVYDNEVQTLSNKSFKVGNSILTPGTIISKNSTNSVRNSSAIASTDNNVPSEYAVATRLNEVLGDQIKITLDSNGTLYITLLAQKGTF